MISEQADRRRARYLSDSISGTYGSFDESDLPSSVRDWEMQHAVVDDQAYSDSEQASTMLLDHSTGDEFGEYSLMGSSK